jgi:hypothetical protein
MFELLNNLKQAKRTTHIPYQQHRTTDTYINKQFAKKLAEPSLTECTVYRNAISEHGL